MKTQLPELPGRNCTITLSKAALMAGIGYILMFGTPVAEALCYNKLVDLHHPLLTIRNISNNLPLLRYGILLYLVNFIGDILAAWAVYILLKPANDFVSVLAAWLRIIYSVLSLVAVMNLLTVLQLAANPAIAGNGLQTQVIIALHSFRDQWSFAFIFFGIYLIVLGYLVIISGYVPKLVGICLLIAGAGWLTDSIQPLLFPNTDFSIGMITGTGELVFMLWLFIKGSRLKELDNRHSYNPAV